MSEPVKRYVVRGKTEDGAGCHFCAEVVIAYDHDRVVQERDTLREEVERLRDVLFDGFRVYTEVCASTRDRLRTSPENVSDTLDAIARILKADVALAEIKEPTHD